jgi:amino acid transporter
MVLASGQEGVPAMGLDGLDGLGSAAYGPEAALTILLPLGAAGLAAFGPILALLAILFASYWQTIKAYPSSGGAHIVSKVNLGTRASLVAAAALMVDYAVATPAHARALPRDPGLDRADQPARNSRRRPVGSRCRPTCSSRASCWCWRSGRPKAIAAGGAPCQGVPPPPLPATTASITLWLLLRASASGCTAMTGVEAVSNGMSAFKEPATRYGRRTLTVIVACLGLFLVGIAYLTKAYGILAMDQARAGYQSVLSQLARAVVGNGLFYNITIGSLLCVLTLSANTSFVDFPRLCRMVAQDGFLPQPFAVAGRRLVFSMGHPFISRSRPGSYWSCFAGSRTG